MEGAGAGAGFRKELVSRLLHVHFKDDKTKGAVSGDALQLMAELLKIFVVGEPRAPPPRQRPGFPLFLQPENQDTFSRFPQGPEPGLLSLLVRSSSPWGAAGPGRRCRSRGCGPAGEGAPTAAPGLLGISAVADATPGKTLVHRIGACF
ncbi:centromere protein X isoform X1 [Saimiri boliviensis]|uniref:centromere protein X isoform X1 n=1 Tax=Saimiri boliviensis TaxID=27679 RepID=UPI000533E0FE